VAAQGKAKEVEVKRRMGKGRMEKRRASPKIKRNPIHYSNSSASSSVRDFISYR
jgi:hypothetical protein